MRLRIPEFSTKEELFKHLKDNAKDFIHQAKSTVKEADGIITSTGGALNKSLSITKAINEGNESDTEIQVKAIINTTNILDSHDDVHIKGIWDKSLKENKFVKHLQEHKMFFDKIISDKSDLSASVKDYEWKDLGYNVEGKTQALVFDSNVKASRNKYMFDQYKEGNVDNHSVGMQYVSLHLCINSTEKYYSEEKENWDKYIEQVVNNKEAENQGFFWAVTEAKVIEGSAVPIGSNNITPTLSPSKDTIVTEEPDAAAKAHLQVVKDFLNIKI